MQLPAPFDTLDKDTLNVLETLIKPVSFPKETLIFEIGSPGDSCYIIEEGLIRLEVPPEGANPDDHENVLNYLEPGTVLGELALLDRLPRSATAYAHSDVKAYVLHGRELDTLAETHPRVTGQINAILGRVASLKLRTITDRLAGFIFKEASPMVDDMVVRARKAQSEFENWPEEKVEALLLALASKINGNAEDLARLNVEETQIGNVPDKVTKIGAGSLGVYQYIAGQTGFGFSGGEADGSIEDVLVPMGVVFGLVPVTNPVSTFIYKVLTCLKGRNAVILSTSRRALRTASRTGELVQEVLEEHGAPLDIVQWVKERNSRKTTSDFMQHEGVDFILATGGPSMVKAAYSSGNPAIGVGSGNAPVLIAEDADIQQAAEQIVSSKSFDNGVVCASEQNLIVNTQVKEQLMAALEAQGAAILSPEEKASFLEQSIDAEKKHFYTELIGKSAAYLAEKTGLQRDYSIRLIVIEAAGVDPEDVLCNEKLLPVVSLIRAANDAEGLAFAMQILEIDGRGHTAIIYSHNRELIQRFGLLIPASRILVNAPGVQGSIGIVTNLAPSLTLGCGTFGGNSTTDNITYRHLLNIKRLTHLAPENG
jgi:acyl-CoA reductase-like NAD-dependent aldehyde dehydrogenase